MPIEAFLIPAFNKVLATALGEGIDLAKNSSETRNLRRLMRQRLTREAKLNSELMNYQHLTVDQKVSAITTEAIDFIMSQPLSLEVFFDIEPWDDFSFHDAANDNHTIWSMSIKSERDLVERWWHRVRLAKIRQDAGVSSGDFEYLSMLCRVLHSTLKDRD